MNSSQTMRRFAICVAVPLVLVGCSVATEPLSVGERQQLMSDTLKAVQLQKLNDGKISLYEAMARALVFNFDTRLDALEEDITKDRLTAGYWNFLPQSVASAGIAHRDKVQASNSVSITTGSESLETSSSTENTRQTGDLRFTWNVLDFGVSYYNLKQTSNQNLMAQERHRRVVRQLLQDVRSAFWRAVAAQRLLGGVSAMLDRLQKAIDTADKIQTDRLQNPLDTLAYKRELYDKLLQLSAIRKNLLSSKLELAKLMNIVPSTSYELVVPKETPRPPKDVGATVERLSLIALQARPEILEAGYNERIAADEVKKSMARMFPGLELSFSTNFDSNKFLLHKNWNDFGLKVSWNLLNFASGWNELEISKKQEAISVLRRQTLGMAVMAQVNIAYLDYDEAVTTYYTINNLADINQQIETLQRSQSSARNMGELQLIKLELDSLVADLRRDEQYANVQNALGRLMYSSGINIYDDLPSSHKVEALAAAIEETEADWIKNGMFKREYSVESPRKQKIGKIVAGADEKDGIDGVQKVLAAIVNFFRQNTDAASETLAR